MPDDAIDRDVESRTSPIGLLGKSTAVLGRQPESAALPDESASGEHGRPVDALHERHARENSEVHEIGRSAQADCGQDCPPASRAASSRRFMRLRTRGAISPTRKIEQRSACPARRRVGGSSLRCRLLCLHASCACGRRARLASQMPRLGRFPALVPRAGRALGFLRVGAARRAARGSYVTTSSLPCATSAADSSGMSR